jgi:hypothetical protein
MYRDDVCAVCGESLPPDHFYCREHAANVDERLHELGALLARAAADLPRLAELAGQIAQETCDWLAEAEPDEPGWPPAAAVHLRLDAEDVAVEVDPDPGMVRVTLRPSLPALLAAVSEALRTGDVARFATACGDAEGANATH